MNFSERHAGLGRPAGHADTPLDDQQAMLGLHQANCSMLLLDDAHDLTFPKEAQNLRTPHHQRHRHHHHRRHHHHQTFIQKAFVTQVIMASGSSGSPDRAISPISPTPFLDDVHRVGTMAWGRRRGGLNAWLPRPGVEPPMHPLRAQAKQAAAPSPQSMEYCQGFVIAEDAEGDGDEWEEAWEEPTTAPQNMDAKAAKAAGSFEVGDIVRLVDVDSSRFDLFGKRGKIVAGSWQSGHYDVLVESTSEQITMKSEVLALALYDWDFDEGPSASAPGKK